jgi:hypothetical protein
VNVRASIGKLGMTALWTIGTFFVVRAAAEPFAISLTDPATYRDDWGGPSLIGVLAVHTLPGVVALALMMITVARARRRSRGTTAQPR